MYLNPMNWKMAALDGEIVFPMQMNLYMMKW